METLTARVKARALALGFTKVGIAEAAPLEDHALRLHEWLSRGYQGSMQWMGRNEEKRGDPRRVLPGCRSVIVVAMNYYTDIAHREEAGKGRISRYAWGDDYHDLLSKRLRLLLQWLLEENPGSEAKLYVDTGPVMEKVWAERAGIGWEGKHTNVITPEVGSWVFLGEILTTLSLERDEPAADHCGDCALCIDACPTGALVEPYVLDSRRCISYLTIEHKGPIDPEIGRNFDGWVYGCDTCQDVCPWNGKFARPTVEEAFMPRDGNIAPDLQTWRNMGPEEFRARFKGSPVTRTRLEGLKRNVREVVQEGDTAS
jgi:epoxyqueuosine reductase